MSEETGMAPYNYESQMQEMVASEGYVPRVAQIALNHKSDEDTGVIAGRFRDKQSGEQFVSKNIVPLQWQGGRVYFPEDEAKSAKPICRSNDGKVPVTDDDNLVPQCSNCKDCPKSQWKRIKKQGRVVNVRPPCDETISLLYIDKETTFPERIGTKGSNVVPMRDFKDSTFKKVMTSMAKKKQGKGEVIPHFGFESTMSSTKIVGKNGTYYNITFTPPKEVGDISEYGPLYERLVTNRGAERAEAAMSDAAEPVGAAAVDTAFETQEYMEA